jgi:putative membrane protein
MGVGGRPFNRHGMNGSGEKKNSENRRSRAEWVGVILRGMAMGTADLVPGVSGGTIAFLTGIYEELLGTLAGLRLSLFGVLKREGLAAAWKQSNLSFLMALVGGMGIAVVALAGFLHHLLEAHPVLLWAFFFGLVAASVPAMLRDTAMLPGAGIRRGMWTKKAGQWGVFGLGAVAAWTITGLPELISDPGLAELVLAGACAICAMILPGISGSFILVILGAYAEVIKAVAELDFLRLGAVGIGCALGLLLFSRALDGLFRKYREMAVALLSGFLLGSLRKLWPWQDGPIDDQWLVATGCALIGAAMLWVLTALSRR